jgi:cytochrome c peroxidase
VRDSGYAGLFREVWGGLALDCVKDVEGTYERIARSIAAYERSPEVNPFRSRFDAFWDAAEAGRAVPRSGIPPVPMINGMNYVRFRGLGLDEAELKGLAVFNTKGKCSTCHLLQPMHGSSYPLFTDFRYHNLGIPANPANPFYGMPRPWNSAGARWVDPGLGGFLAATSGTIDLAGNVRDYTAFFGENLGRHKTPTLRNVEMRPFPGFVKSYGHNGYFKSLPEIVHFYNFRDVLPACGEGGTPGVDCWPAPEESANLETATVGNLGLSPEEGMALIRFIGTLTDLPAPVD